MKKFSLLLGIVASCFLFFLSFNLVLASENINNFSVLIEVNEDASLQVTETIDYNFASNYRHGIFRDIPLNYDVKGEKGKIRISEILVEDEFGKKIKTQINNFNNYKKIKIGDPDKTITGSKKYFISYKVKGAVFEYDDHDEIYWNATGDEWQVPIEKSEVRIIFDKQFNKDDLSLLCYVGGNGEKNDCSKKDYVYSEKGVVGGVYFSDLLRPGQGLSAILSFPKNEVVYPGFSLFDFVFEYLYLFIPLMVLFIMFILWFRKGRDHEGRGVVVAQFDQPDSLSAAEVGVLYDDRVENKDITAAIIELAVKGYIKIARIKSEKFFKDDDYILEKLKEEDDLLCSHENNLLKYLFAGKNRIKSIKEIKKQMIQQGVDVDSFIFKTLMSALKWQGGVQELSVKDNKNIVKLSSLKYEFANKIIKLKGDLYKKMAEDGYYKKNPELVRMKYSLLIIVVFMLNMLSLSFIGDCNIFLSFSSSAVSAVIVIIFGRIMPARTKKGSEAREHVLGLKLYLTVAEKDRIEFHNNPKKDPETFEKLLPFAMVLGVEKEWAKQFEDIYIAEPSWYSNNSGSFNTVSFAGSLKGFTSRANSILSATHSGGGSGGSGGSGGGGGGGGGGSW